MTQTSVRLARLWRQAWTARATIRIPTTPASALCVYSMMWLRSRPGTTSPLQNGQPWKPEPPGPQPSPESDTRTMPPTMISRKVATPVARASLR